MDGFSLRLLVQSFISWETLRACCLPGGAAPRMAGQGTCGDPFRLWLSGAGLERARETQSGKGLRAGLLLPGTGHVSRFLR